MAEEMGMSAPDMPLWRIDEFSPEARSAMLELSLWLQFTRHLPWWKRCLLHLLREWVSFKQAYCSWWK